MAFVAWRPLLQWPLKIATRAALLSTKNKVLSARPQAAMARREAPKIAPYISITKTSLGASDKDELKFVGARAE